MLDPRTVTGDRRRAGCALSFFYMRSGWMHWTELSLGTSSRRFEHSEPSSNYILTELARYIFSYRRLGWFDWTEPFVPTSLQGRHVVQGTSNLIEPSLTTSSQS